MAVVSPSLFREVSGRRSPPARASQEYGQYAGTGQRPASQDKLGLGTERPSYNSLHRLGLGRHR
ncbi:hypothetical protein P280DRAFT_240165 [Massarina eburnea CBS 473.64]|uniref:Uncharacterized protein n=1 Tax=Massarina eburnea CBS 473.64 TaxID=1395130 RepID=A0A6A6S5L9_9PLEO|nr:hypothetical protein P280DRAFT_240165 [Massarina eburnea CBS 473.64]